jgi:protein-S-isoprenylcysteine O-methyltransferase Ste14
MRETLVHVVVAAWVVAVLVWVIESFRTKATVRRENISSGIAHRLPLMAAYLLLFGAGLSMGPLDRRLLPVGIAGAWAGAAITLLGLSLAIAARFFLGTNWSSSVTVKQDHELVQSGPYRFVRHPIYSGLLLAMLGTALAFNRWRDILGVFFATAAFKMKSLGEESFMKEQFGQRYQNYMQRVKALIPFIW